MGTGEMRRRARFWLVVMVIGLVLSGATAFPLDHGSAWLVRVAEGLPAGLCPFIAYGTDWLAFAHLTIAAAFWGPLRDPVRNIWVVRWGLLACAGIIPLALICGPLRGIPFGWSLVDMSFGVFGAVPLLLAYRWIRRLERAEPVAGGARAAVAVAA